jgi:outer membrane protein insertion porin family
MRLALLLTLIVVFPLPSRAGGAVHAIHFRGNSHFTDRELSGVMTLKEGGAYSAASLARDMSALRDFYAHEGYCLADISVDSIGAGGDSSRVDILLSVTEGERLAISGITVEGAVALPVEQILAQFETRTGGYLVRELLERDIDGLLSRYERIGYPFAQVSVESVAVASGPAGMTLRLAMRVVEGPQVTIDELRVEGNRETQADVVVRETRIALHEKYDQDKISKIRPRLARLGIFSTVGEPQLYLTQAGGGLLIGVQEAPSNTFDGILGYAPGAGRGGGGGLFSGMVNVSMRNLFGTGRKLYVRWQRDDESSQEIALAYTEPWVLNLPLNLRGGFQQRQQEGLYVQRGLDLNADLLLSESLTFGGLLHNQQVIPANGTTAVFQSRTLTTGLEIRYDTRDDAVSPTRGINYRSGYELGAKKIFGIDAAAAPGIQQSSAVQKLSLDAEVFLPSFQRQVVALAMHGRQITNDRIELGDLYRFGGTTTLRGYRENEFLGSRIAWTNAEYRFLLARRAFFCGFFDTGYYYLPGDASTASSQAVKYGYGVGFRFETALGNMGVSFAFGGGDSFSQGKIHLGLLNDF